MGSAVWWVGGLGGRGPWNTAPPLIVRFQIFHLKGGEESHMDAGGGRGEVGVWGRVTFSDCGIVCECECVWGGQRLMHVWCVHIQGSARIPAPALFRVIHSYKF